MFSIKMSIEFQKWKKNIVTKKRSAGNRNGFQPCLFCLLHKIQRKYGLTEIKIIYSKTV